MTPDPNARDNWSYTPLHEASIKGKNDVCVMLLQVAFRPTARPSPSCVTVFSPNILITLSSTEPTPP